MNTNHLPANQTDGTKEKNGAAMRPTKERQQADSIITLYRKELSSTVQRRPPLRLEGIHAGAKVSLLLLLLERGQLGVLRREAAAPRAGALRAQVQRLVLVVLVQGGELALKRQKRERQKRTHKRRETNEQKMRRQKERRDTNKAEADGRQRRNTEIDVRTSGSDYENGKDRHIS